MSLKGTPNGIPTGINWQKALARMDDPRGRKSVAKAMSDYFNQIRGKAPLKHMVSEGMKTTRPGHNELPQREEIDVRVYSARADLGLLSLFEYVDKRSSNNPTHKYASVNGGQIQFQERGHGEKARIQPIRAPGAEMIHSVPHHGALGIDDDEQRFDEYMVFERALQTVPGKWDNYVADMAAQLIKALTGITQTWDTDLVMTANKAATQILEDVGDLYGVADSTAEFAMVFNPNHITQVQKAFASAYTAPNDNVSGSQFAYTMRPVMTRKLAPADGIHIVLPGHDMLDVEWDALFAEYGRDWQAGSDNWVYRARRNLGIGNTGQLRKITPQ
ncbi:hypothetical protein [Natronospira bacteriovora]|uniref:Capsid protein n=1 Tax=Natronospira bacteriovora TaxID=3069753 RepID=A0ABU0W5N3_9GAMM|nr:hypothetical protein [Natronospira sp. AB-CW4]MDQ2069322.1 hypothetical protein [Natronospira sp. AB-CW4]